MGQNLGRLGRRGEFELVRSLLRVTGKKILDQQAFDSRLRRRHGGVSWGLGRTGTGTQAAEYFSESEPVQFADRRDEVRGRGALLLRAETGQSVGANSAHEGALRVHHGERFRSRGPQGRSADPVRDRMRRAQFQRVKGRVAPAGEQLPRRHSTDQALGTIEDEETRGGRIATVAEAGQSFFYRQVGVKNENCGVGQRAGRLVGIAQGSAEPRTNRRRKRAERGFPDARVQLAQQRGGNGRREQGHDR